MILVDTGPFLARYLARDQYHRQALSGWERLRTSTQRCFTSSSVLAETFTLLARRAGYSFAAPRARNILMSRRWTILRPGQEDEWKAVEDFEKFGDQRVSFTDCLSFVLMRRHRIKKAFTFDRHFQAAGFSRWG